MSGSSGESDRTIEIRRADPDDRAWLARIMDEEWGGPVQVADGESYCPADLPNVVAEIGGERVGFAALRVVDRIAWIGVIQALRSRRGVGSALVAALAHDARAQGCPVLRAITTNDNRVAQDFYTALGFRLIEVRPGAVEESRKLKPSIPMRGESGTSITDELEYELTL